jgi:hypothetical protein
MSSMRIRIERECIQAYGSREDIFALASLLTAEIMTLGVMSSNASLCWSKYEIPKHADAAILSFSTSTV